MLVAAVERALRALRIADRGVVVAVSGGIDSTVLAHAMAEVAPGLGLDLRIAHVHHGLRGEAADADADAARALASALGLPFDLERVDPGALRAGRSNRERPTLQEAARSVRYEALRRVAGERGARHVATAHNLDDQAETVFMRLLRGTGPDGLGGIPERSPDGVLVRPMLDVPRSEIEAFAKARGLAWREDASNESDDYTRNRIRRHWLPELAREFNPQLLRAVGQLAEAQRRDAEWISDIVEAQSARMWSVRDDSLALVRDGWSALPEPLARRVVRRALVEMGAGRDVTRAHITRMLDFLRGDVAPQKALELPGGLLLITGSDGHVLRRNTHASGAKQD